MTPHLFTPIEIDGLHFPNRIAPPPEDNAEPGLFNAALTMCYPVAGKDGTPGLRPYSFRRQTAEGGVRFLRWLQSDFGSRQTVERPREKRGQGERAAGDFRGSYGFGRRAHRPDPNAHYVFDNNRRRGGQDQS